MLNVEINAKLFDSFSYYNASFIAWTIIQILIQFVVSSFVRTKLDIIVLY